MYEKKLKHCVKKLLGLLLLLLPLFGGAQVRYPVSVNGFFVQPRIFISDYLLAGSGNIRAGLRFNDLTEPPREVYLRLSMESATAKLESNPNHWFTPITLSPGELVSLSDIDFAEYLSLDRLLFRGVDKSAVVRSGRLPEGLYTFRLQVLDYRSREVIGSATPFTVMLRLNPPPALIFPRNGSVINCDIAQNVLFQWQLNSPFVTPLNTSYTLALYEVNDDAQLPQAALANGQVRQAYVSEPAAELSRLYSAFEPLLECGKRYTYTITASDADGRDVFKNRGQSEAGWFYYGYPTGGAIPLTYPPNGGAFAISSKKTLRWGGSDKFLPNQPASYHVKMVELAEGDDPEEAMTRRAFLEHSTREGRQPDGGQVDLSGLGSAKAFAWQVKATTGLQEVAQSAVYTFEGAPLVEEFYAGTHLLKVVRGQGSFGSYSGEAEVTLGKDGKTYTIPFKDISLNSSSGLYTLGSDIVVPIPQGFGNITLAAQVERNGEATFFPDSLRVSPDGLALHGRITWAYPFAVDAKEKPYVRTKPTWASFNDLTLSGTADLAAGNTFALLEPMSFTMALDEASRIIFDKNEHRLWFRGHMVAPQSVRGVKEAAYRLYFQDFEQLFYNTVSGYACGNKTYTIPNTNLLLHPQTYTLDLDDTQSAGKLADKPEWQGIYYDRFTVEYPTTLDDMRQVIPAQLIAHRFEEADSSYAYLQASGLMLGIFDRGFGEDEVAGFNCFPSVFNEWRLIVESSRVKSGHLKGSIRLPLISPTLRYPYTVPISPLGLQTGYLDQTLDNTTFEHHPDGGEQHITFTILRAVFADRNRLVLNVDMNYHYLNTTFAGLQGLTIWGRGYEAGFGTPGGTMALTHQQTAMVKGFETTFDHVGAGRNGNLYAVGVSGKMNMGEDVTGVGGAPIANFYSVVENPLLAGVPKSGGNLYENTPVASNEGSGFTPTSDVGVPREGEEVVIDMRIAGFEEKNELLDELSQIAQQYGEKLDVDTAKLPMFEEIQKNTSTSAEQSAITFDQVKQMVDVILAIAEFLDESEDNNPPVIKQLFEDLEDWQIQTLIKKSSTLNEFKADLLKELASKITDKIKEPIEQTEQKAQNFISTKINGLADTAMQPVVALMNEAFEKARPSLLALSPKDSAIINKSITAAKKAIVGNIDKAVKEAVDTEIVGAVNGFIHSAIAGRVYGLVDSIVGKSLYSLAEGQKPDFSNVGDELGGALTGMGQDVVKFVSLDNIGAMLGNTATAAWNNVDMMKIMDDITRELTKQGLNQYVSDQATKAVQGAVTDLLGESAGKTAGSVAAAVNMDFGAIAQGDFKNAVTFDPSAIVIHTPVAKISGYVKFVEDDPVWGQSWQAMLNAEVLVPKPFAAYVRYINGAKARADNSTFKYWIIDVGVSKLGLALSPLPVVMDAAMGKVYQHVQRDPASNTYSPSEAVRFGVNLDAQFFDQTGGKAAFFEVGLGVNVLDRGFILEIYGKVDAANLMSKDKDGNLTLKKSLIAGDGRFTLNTVDGTFLGRSTVKTNTDPLVCAGGAMDIAITKNNFLFALGTREQPLQLDVLCRGKPQMAGWFALSSGSLDMGAFIDIDIKLETGWLGGGCAKVKPWMRFLFKSGFTTLVYWDPFKIAEASIWLDMYAGVGVKYDFCLKSGNLTIAEVGLGGKLKYASDPRSVISGTMYGKVRVLGVGFDVDFSAKVEL